MLFDGSFVSFIAMLEQHGDESAYNHNRTAQDQRVRREHWNMTGSNTEGRVSCPGEEKQSRAGQVTLTLHLQCWKPSAQPRGGEPASSHRESIPAETVLVFPFSCVIRMCD